MSVLLIDIQSYCYELSNLTGLDVDSIKEIVSKEVAKVCLKGESYIEFSDNIENEIINTSNNTYKLLKTSAIC